MNDRKKSTTPKIHSAVCKTCKIAVTDEDSLVVAFALWHAAHGHEAHGGVNEDYARQMACSAGALYQFSDAERDRLRAFAFAYDLGQTQMKEIVLARTTREIKNAFAYRYYGDNLISNTGSGSLGSGLHRTTIVMPDPPTGTLVPGTEDEPSDVVDARLKAAYSDHEIKLIRKGRVDDVVLRRWYNGEERPPPVGRRAIDCAIEGCIAQINILPAGQPANSPRWSGIRYGDVTWNVNGTDVDMGTCPEPAGTP